MIGPWLRPRGTRVAPRNLEQIRRVAIATRTLLKVEDPRIDMIDLLENKLRNRGIHFHLVQPSDIPGDAARAIPQQGKLLLSIEAYDAIHNGDRVQELLIPHEIGHFALMHDTTAVFSREITWHTHTALEDSEVQADRFSHEFAMPINMVKEHCRSLSAIEKIFNVPKEDARIRMEQLRQEGLIDW